MPRKSSLVSAISLAGTLACCPAAFAGSAPADPCSLLPAAEVGKALGRDVAAPQSSVAPRPFKDTAQGTDCLYKSKSGRGSVGFRIYFDPSPSDATALFQRLHGYYGSGTPAAIGDEAYFDSKQGLHARKGNARFFLELNGIDAAPPAKEKMLTNLGTGIAGRL